MMNSTATATLTGAVRYQNKEGAPHWRILVGASGGYDTKPGAQINYEVENHTAEGATESWVGELVNLRLDNGQVVEWARIPVTMRVCRICSMSWDSCKSRQDAAERALRDNWKAEIEQVRPDMISRARHMNTCCAGCLH